MKIEFIGECRTPSEVLEANARHARGLGLPKPSRPSRLAVVAGGPSINDRIEEIRDFPGDIWGCSSAFPWCRKNGIHATYFNIDPVPGCAPEAKGATRAILAAVVDPSVFDALKGADVQVFDLIGGQHWATTATAVPYLAVEMGYTEIHFFGCESSFAQTTHAYRNEKREYQILVQCGPNQYLTAPDYFMQAEYLSQVIKACPSVFKDRSGGLLGAMVEHDFDIIGGTPEFKESLNLRRAA